MKKKKYYAVAKGKTPGIYNSWDACKKQVTGVSNLYKSFASLEEAKAFMKAFENTSSKAGAQNTKNNDTYSDAYFEEIMENLDKNSAIAFTDGSYDIKTKAYSAGVLLCTKTKKYEFAKAFEENAYASMRNVAGEITAALIAVSRAYALGISELTICHDYSGISAWADGIWKAENKLTKNYTKIIQTFRKKINISFLKIKSHSGNSYNDAADRIAKDALKNI